MNDKLTREELMLLLAHVSDVRYICTTAEQNSMIGETDPNKAPYKFHELWDRYKTELAEMVNQHRKN